MQRSVAGARFSEAGGDGRQSPTIKDNPPLIYHPREKGGEELLTRARVAFADYRDSLPDDRRVLLDRFELKDIAIKVVGVGSVGTFCGVMLLMASERDPLFLQVKEARPSVLEAYAGKSIYPQPWATGRERVSAHAIGERHLPGLDRRQARPAFLCPPAPGHEDQGRWSNCSARASMIQYAEFCGWALARAHARSGEPAQISGYLGKSDTFDKAIAAFAVAYADQSERDHDVLLKAAQAGRVEVVMEAE